MTKYDMIFKGGIALFIIGGIGFAVYRADNGSVTAGALLGAIGAIIFLVIAAGLIIGTQYALAGIEAKRFTANAKENLQIINSMATAQNKQNRLMAQQLKQLPEPETQESLLIDDAIFCELEGE